MKIEMTLDQTLTAIAGDIEMPIEATGAFPPPTAAGLHCTSHGCF